MKKSKRKFVLAGLFLLAAIITGLTLTGCETEVDPSTPQQEQPVTYTVTFNANGGTGTMESQTFTAGTTQSLSANEFQRSGWAFNGWNTMADGSGASYADKASFTATEDTTLYAKWRVTAAAGIAAVVVEADGTSRKEHETLSGAILDAYSKDGSTLYVTQNYSGEYVYISRGIFTLDLNGMTMENPMSNVLVIDGDAHLTITDTIGGGKILTTCVDTGISSVQNNATLVIKSGSIEGVFVSVQNNGPMIVTGGSISSTGEGAISVNSIGNLTISGGSITSDNGRAVLCDRGNLILSGNPAISSGGTNPTTGLPYGGIYLPNASSGGSIDGALTMTTPITVETDLSNLSAGKWTAFQGTGGYQITDDDLKKLQPIVTDLPASMTSAMGMLNGATLSTALEGNAIVVKVTPKQ